jgi:hypothetical protein
MRFLRAAVEEVVGLFVGEWTQTLISIAILGAAWLLLARTHGGPIAFVLAVALAAQLIYATTLQARRTAKGRSGH